MVLPVMLWWLFTGTSAVTIVQDPPVLYTPEGQSAVISCEVRADENLKILYYHWYLNNTHPDRILENSTRVTIIDNSLIISSVTPNDTGIYICTAQDSNLHVYQGNGTYLQVQGTSAMTIVQDPPFLYTAEGQRAVISCEVRGDENLRILHYHWYLNNIHPDRILRNSTRVTVMDNSLIFSLVTTDDNGIYICTVRDYNLHVYQGNGTHLLVQDNNPQVYYKYLYFLFIPLLILLLYLIFRFLATVGVQTRGAKMRHTRRWLFCFQKKDNDTELHYSTIVPKVKGSQMKPRNMREEVEYAPVKIAISNLSLSYIHDTSGKDSSSLVYATLKTEES